jgi:hypothetical protein
MRLAIMHEMKMAMAFMRCMSTPSKASGLRSWLYPHRGISQEKLPWYFGFFEFIHNVRRRGKALLHSLLATLLAP